MLFYIVFDSDTNILIEEIYLYIYYINISKPFYMVCQLARITSSCESIAQKTVKFEGIIVDGYLKWNHHIQHITIKITKAIRILYKAK